MAAKGISTNYGTDVGNKIWWRLNVQVLYTKAGSEENPLKLEKQPPTRLSLHNIERKN